MKKLDIINAMRNIVADQDNRKYDGYNVVANYVHGLGNDNIRSASTISAEYKKDELEDALIFFHESIVKFEEEQEFITYHEDDCSEHDFDDMEWADEEMENEDEMLAGMLTESGLEEKILTKIMNLTADQNEYDGDPELYELYYHNKQIEIETLQDVLHMMKGGEE